MTWGVLIRVRRRRTRDLGSTLFRSCAGKTQLVFGLAAAISLLPIWRRYQRTSLHEFNNVLRPRISVDGYIPFATPSDQLRHINRYLDEGDSRRLDLFPSLVRYGQPLLVCVLKTPRIRGDFTQLLPLSGRIPSNPGNGFAALAPLCDFSSVLLLMKHDPS